MKLRHWRHPNLPAPTRFASVSPDTWLSALIGEQAARTQVVWRLAGHRTVLSDWQISQRKVGEHLIYLITDGGSVSLALDQQNIVLSPGMLMWLAPNVPHRLIITDPDKSLTLYHMRFCVRRSKTDLYVKPVVNILHDAHGVQWEMEQIVKELYGQEKHAQTRCRAMLASLSATVFRQGAQVMTSGPTLTGAQRGCLIEYARIRVTQWPRPSDLARQVGLSAGYFARVFRNSFGQSPRQWLFEQRIYEAARLLVESNMNISQIAEYFGYQDVFQFSHQFKKVTGLCPTHYRKTF